MDSSFSDAGALLDVGCTLETPLKNWKIVSFVDKGGFGKIFKAQNVRNESEKVVIKVEITPGRKYLDIEGEIYQQLSGKKGFPRLFWSGIAKFERLIKGEKKALNCRILVLELLGTSLGHMFSDLHHNFSLQTVLLLSIQMLDRLEVLHDAGVIHRDIKPSNFLLNKEGNFLYLIDFGLSEFYIKSGKHISCAQGIEFRGTHKFASLNAHCKIQQSRRDDLSSLAYNLIYLARGLPWYDLKIERKERREVLGRIKANISSAELAKGLPVCFQKLFDYAADLTFEARPDYDYLRKLFTHCLSERRFSLSMKFEWEKEEEKPSLKSTRDSQDVASAPIAFNAQDLCTSLLIQHFMGSQQQPEIDASLTPLLASSESQPPSKKAKLSTPTSPSNNLQPNPSILPTPRYLPRESLSPSPLKSPMSFSRSPSSPVSPSQRNLSLPTKTTMVDSHSSPTKFHVPKTHPIQTQSMELFPSTQQKIIQPFSPEKNISLPKTNHVIDAYPSPTKFHTPETPSIPLESQLAPNVELAQDKMVEPLPSQIPHQTSEPSLPVQYKVKIPDEILTKNIIDTLSSVVVQLRAGIQLELMLKVRQQGNPLFSFLSEPLSDLGLYYHWRVYSLLNNDTLLKWRTEPFQIILNGPIWFPPPLPIQ